MRDNHICQLSAGDGLFSVYSQLPSHVLRLAGPTERAAESFSSLNLQPLLIFCHS